MKALSITFIGAPECGNVGKTTIGPPGMQLDFPLNTPVIIDRADAKNKPQAEVWGNIMSKLADHPHFRTEEVQSKKPDEKLQDKPEGGNGPSLADKPEEREGLQKERETQRDRKRGAKPGEGNIKVDQSNDNPFDPYGDAPQ